MIKKAIWILILLAVTACSVLMGEGFDIPFLNPTSTTPVVTVQPTEVLTEPAATETPAVTETAAITEIPTEVVTEVTATQEVTEEVTPTETEVLTEIPTVTVEPTEVEELVTDLFSVQTGSPKYMQNFAHQDKGCNWSGIAGQLFDSSGNPMINYIIKVTGTYGDETISMLSVTSLIIDKPYGPGSYEIIFGDEAIKTNDTLSIQIFDSAGFAVTNKLKFDTSASCDNNLIIMNFSEL